MPEEQIRRYAEIANSMRPDLIVLTGDFVTWDPSVQTNVVRALSVLDAPYGVFGCLGNHEAWTDTKDSIPDLFDEAGIRILRDELHPIVVSRRHVNLIGIEPDYGWTTREVPEDLLFPDDPAILLSHYPTVFDHAAANGIDLMLSGHTHGGQVKLDFVSREIAPRLLNTPYVEGWYAKGESRLYVNRGIGTIGAPVRAGMPPEITVFELQA
jgi:hypothetical protein